MFQKVYDKVQTQAAQASAIKRYLIRRALTVGTYRVRDNQSTVGTLWDKLVFSKVKHGAGWEHVRVIVSGAAPLPGYLVCLFSGLYARFVVIIKIYFIVVVSVFLFVCLDGIFTSSNRC